MLKSAGELDEKDLQIIEEHIESEVVRRRILIEDMILKHRASKLEIWIKTEDIRKQTRGSYALIPCTAKLVNTNVNVNNIAEVQSLVAWGHWYELKDLKGEEINLLDYFDKIFPKQKRGIGLFTFQNGIQNTFDNFKKMGNLILEQFKRRGHLDSQSIMPLCIGLYNETSGPLYGLTDDLIRLNFTWGSNPISALFIRQMMATLANILPSINPNIYWVHIAHSEGGLITNYVLTSDLHVFLEPQKTSLTKRLITITFGAVAPIPDKHVLLAINTYSKDDIALRFVKKYLDKIPLPNEEDGFIKIPGSSISTSSKEVLKAKKNIYIGTYPYTSEKDGYTITVVKNVALRKDQPIIEGDHAFDGKTYQLALENNIKKLKESYGII